jgi:hypothetical protein
MVLFVFPFSSCWILIGFLVLLARVAWISSPSFVFVFTALFGLRTRIVDLSKIFILARSAAGVPASILFAWTHFSCMLSFLLSVS